MAGIAALANRQREIDAPVDQPRPGTSPLGHVHVSNASACAMLCDHRPTQAFPLGHVHVSNASACAMLCDHSGSTPAMHTMPLS
uniref:Uncharacterized protein n=1 Tax=Oryza sativa subsp. japonica TaxID=39947 RepID=Q6K5U5_ORYSJ|nr:hypothetical protein [Oryza sativa Japonica Group]